MGKKLTNLKGRDKNKRTLADTGEKSGSVLIDFKFLDRCDVSCFNSLSKFDTKNKEQKVFTELQHFLYESSKCKNVEELVGQYGSKNGPKISSNNNGFAKRVVNKFIEAYPEESGLVSDDVLHIHTKRNGKGKFVIFGASWENVFYVLAFDPNHDFK